MSSNKFKDYIINEVTFLCKNGDNIIIDENESDEEFEPHYLVNEKRTLKSIHSSISNVSFDDWYYYLTNGNCFFTLEEDFCVDQPV
jgi:hypothetical protein